MPLTKIVCTLGPATDHPDVIRAMIRAGMTVARLNFSHGSAEEKRRTVTLVRQVAQEERHHVALMGDLQGPKIRVGDLPEAGVELEEHEEVVLTSAEVEVPAREIPFPHPEVIADVQAGDRVLLDDGTLELVVLEVAAPRLRCRVRVGGRLHARKGVNLPDVKLQIPALTEKDKRDALQALELELDYLALSFVRRAADIEELRRYLRANTTLPEERQVGENPHHIPGIVAKIEKPQALDDLEAIVRISDVVMVARGDLGVETAPEAVPLAQKRIIRMCNRLGKPVITATQMLQSMIENPRPTRAEASDVANAILDGSDAVMLSGETSIGRYPAETVRMMAKIAETVEASHTFPYNQLLVLEPEDRDTTETEMINSAISRASVGLAEAAHAVAILSSTESGRTARMVARHRPHVPLLGITPFAATARRMQVIWGVIPMEITAFYDTDQMIRNIVQAAATYGCVEVGDNVIMTAGIPLEVHGVTNMVKVHTVREADLA
jgi:pyruvate kinase